MRQTRCGYLSPAIHKENSYLFPLMDAKICVQSSDKEDDLYGGAWCAEPEERDHWFQVDARREVEFSGLITQGKNSEQQ